MPKISVIVPVYKVEQYLNRCVDSILNQTFKDFELILVDDGSPDNCPAICDEYAAQYYFIHVIHKENGGLSDARNYGIDYAMTTDSEWIAFIDSDDWVHPQFLEILYKTAIKYKVSVCSCDFYYFVKEDEIKREYHKINELTVYKGNAEFLITRNMNTIAAWLRLYKKNCFLNIRFPVGKLFEDMRTIYKVLYHCRQIVYVPNKLYYYFRNTTGICLSQFTIDKAIDEIKAHEEHLMFLFNNGYYIATENRYKGYSCLVEKLLKTYQGEQVDFVYKHFCEIRDKIFSDRKYINALRKQKKKQQIQDLKNDFNAVKKEKNTWYAILFYVKNYLKICFSRGHM